MMVATGLPITPQSAPAAAPAVADAPAEGVAAGGGFLGALMQMLASQDPAEGGGASAATAVAALLDDPEGDAPDAVPSPDAAVPFAALVVPSVQPAEIRAAQQLARQVGDGSDSVAPLIDNTSVPVALSRGSRDGEFALLERLGGAMDPVSQSQAAEPAAIGLQGAVPQPSVADSVTTLKSPATDAPVPRQIHTPVGTPGWSDELGGQLHLMADKGQSVASLRLSPEHLGPLEVQISVQDNQASVWFGAANADTRAAIEQAMPRLRELFAAQGMSLMQSGVFNQSSRDPGRQAPGPASLAGAAEGVAGPDPAVHLLSARGLIDAYA